MRDKREECGVFEMSATSAVLTRDLVLAKARAETYDEVRSLNLWGCELTDVSIVAELPVCAVLSLSVNCVDSLAVFAKCPALEELYLRKNKVTDIREVAYLRNLAGLRKLWLSDNPCSSHEQCVRHDAALVVRNHPPAE